MDFKFVRVPEDINFDANVFNADESCKKQVQDNYLINIDEYEKNVGVFCYCKQCIGQCIKTKFEFFVCLQKIQKVKEIEQRSHMVVIWTKYKENKSKI